MKLTPARIINALDGIRPLARELDLDPATVFGWINRGRIPRWHHKAILAVARKKKFPLTQEQLA